MKRIITFGEIMLRLKSPANERLMQSPSFNATFGGGEANVAVSLSRFGENAAFVSAIPGNAMGDACLQELRKQGVETGLIARQGDRLGIYFLETGSTQRPSLVVYDRAHSAISQARPGDFDWQKILTGADWFHITGITPAISASAAELSLEAVQAAQELGVTVSLDLNFRKKLWKYGKSAPEVMEKLILYTDVVIGNEEDFQKSLGLECDVNVEEGVLQVESFEKLTGTAMRKYSNLKKAAVTMRESISANHNNWSAAINNGKDFFVSRKYEMRNIVDRVGGGDSFAAGLIYGLNNLSSDQEALEFAVAASCLKHSIMGDFNLTSVAEVLALARGSGTGRVQR